MILFLSLMYKTMGGGSWTGLWADVSVKPEVPKIRLEVEPLQQIKIESMFGQQEAVDAISSQVSMDQHNLTNADKNESFLWWMAKSFNLVRVQ